MIGITQTHYIDLIVFGICGSGENYTQLYKTLYNKYTPINVRSDMPWHYFRLSKEEEELFIKDKNFTKYNSDLDTSKSDIQFNKNDW